MREFLINKLLCLDLVDTNKVNQYIDFCLDKCVGKHIVGKTERHHILPKADRLFPEYKDFNLHPWNRVYLNYEDHELAHKLLAEAIENESLLFASWIASKNSADGDIRKKLSNIRSRNQTYRNKDPNVIAARLKTMRMEINGSTLFNLTGKKISESLKNHVYAFNMMTQQFEYVNKNAFDETWYLVGRTAKFLTLYEREGFYFTSSNDLIAFFNLTGDIISSRGKSKLMKRLKLPINEIIENFNHFNLNMKGGTNESENF